MCRRRCDSNRSHVSTAAFVFCPRLNYHRTSSLSSVLVRFVFVRRISLDADSSPAPHLSSHTDAGASSFILSPPASPFLYQMVRWGRMRVE
jgi:hypothetical protein